MTTLSSLGELTFAFSVIQPLRCVNQQSLCLVPSSMIQLASLSITNFRVLG